MSGLGYLAYLGFIFLPGIGLGELLGVWRKEDPFATRVAYSFGLGLAVDTTVVMVRTSGLSPALTGLDSWTVYGVIIFGLAAILVSFLVRGTFTWYVKPRLLDIAVLAILLVQGIMILIYFQKYPIFPEYQSPDYATHVQIAQSLISGTSSSITAGALYYGIHFQLASSLILVGGVPLVTVRSTMAILTILSPLLFYLVVQRLSSSETAGTLAALIYSLSGAIWFGSVFNSGLYANFFGVLSVLFLVIVLLDFRLDRSFGIWVVLGLAIVMTYFSHYTAITILPAVFLLAPLEYLVKRTFPKRLFLGSLLVIAPGAVGLLAYPGIMGHILQLATAGGGLVIGGTWLSGELSTIPVLSYMATEFTYDLGFAIMVLLAGVCVWRAVTGRKPLALFVLVWLVSLLVVSPFNVSAWRFSYEALVPLTLLGALGLYSLLPKIEIRKGRKPSPSLYWKAGILLLIILVPLFAGAWGVSMVSDGTTQTQISAQAQVSVNETIAWLGSHTPQNSTYLSVSDWRFTYTSLFLGRETTYSYISQPSVALQYAHQEDVPYIIVTNLVTAAVPDIPQDFPWNTFPVQSNSNLTLVYSNSDVRVYQVG